jgi:hypothetical protein
VSLDSVDGVSLATLVERPGRLSDERMRQVCAALDVAVAWSSATAASSARYALIGFGGNCP